MRMNKIGMLAAMVMAGALSAATTATVSAPMRVPIPELRIKAFVISQAP